MLRYSYLHNHNINITGYSPENTKLLFRLWTVLDLSAGMNLYHFISSIFQKIQCRFTLEWRHNERHGFSNHRSLDCVLNRLFRRRSKKTSNSVSPLVGGIHRWAVNSTPKGRVTRKCFHLMTSSCFCFFLGLMIYLWIHGLTHCAVASMTKTISYDQLNATEVNVKKWVESSVIKSLSNTKIVHSFDMRFTSVSVIATIVSFLILVLARAWFQRIPIS